MHRFSLLVVPGLAILVELLLAPDIVVRHDREEERFRELGRQHGDALVLIRARDQAGIVVSEGTLIAPRFVVTAAHVAGNVSPSDSVGIGGKYHSVGRVHVHPGWNPDQWMHDIGVLELSDGVSGVEPVRLYRRDDEMGREIVIVGRGMFGTGRTGPVEDDGVLRGATNRIDRVLGAWIRFTFEAPESPEVTDLEGISGPGDSGGPAFLVGDGARQLVGVSSAQDDSASGGQPGQYGVQEYYTRVSAYADWIDGIVGR